MGDPARGRARGSGKRCHRAAESRRCDAVPRLVDPPGALSPRAGTSHARRDLHDARHWRAGTDTAKLHAVTSAHGLVAARGARLLRALRAQLSPRLGVGLTPTAI